ncbi:uncharacterized protein si:dkeyp-68b7.12 isoform X2 [Takifugu flavidus]|uniref:uncharacterized protein si:dkeyp-68b7.12 isoform X2 n=1 Tax=Takifugu flavidus TaxID=433684 RepID=UPI002544925C|nr:uncharacterized protein si:dkeyp-68b7.12 isoform X2 [Takifugu flavidus]
MRRVRKKGTNKEKVFGCDLLEHLNASSQEVPHVLRSCSEFVETHGVVDGIYRLSGVSSNIQKLRADFESEGTPDLNKDVYLQDIHSVSSLCKAYFRELPNPLLTYQLYDKFADAVAIQLEEERLLKIRHVLKELPSLHYRTLEYLMHHLLRMASYSSETNMHARNLAIVWAPNLLRSKDIEASGFNGTAVFKEVRVQSIVVEFILTHVPQLFPEQESNQDEDSIKFRHTQPVLTFGNICPGDAPLPIRPYHAIIEGSEKRKGSLKGRKWMSIFNIGSRFHDPLRRQKHSVKEKDRNALRPARSMDSLSTPSYPNEGSRGTSQHPSNKSPPLMTPSSHSGLDTFAGAIGRSEYAVTYRRGTGAVSAGNQGTSAALDLEGVKSPNHESVQSKSPGDSAKMSRRAAMHITGPTLVTVPLHITTNLAFGVLQRGGGDKIIHYSRDKDGKDKITDKEKGDEVEIKDEEGDKNDKEILMERTEDKVACGGIEIERDGMKEKQHEDCGHKPEMMMADVFREMRPKILSSDFEEASVVTHEMDHDEDSEYMVMKSSDCADFAHEEMLSNVSDNLNSTEDDLTLSGYVQDNFEFLDHMDCSVLEHMECTVPYQVHEFSVEPPGHSDDEYEVMEQGQPSHHVDELQRHTESKSPKQLSIDANGRHIKSLSLPYMTSPIHGQEESGSDDDDDDNDVDDYNSEDEENMFVKSLPSYFFSKELSGCEPEIERQEKYSLEIHPVDVVQITDDEGIKHSPCLESTTDKIQIGIKDTEVSDRWEENKWSRTEDKAKNPQEQSKTQSTVARKINSIMEDPRSSNNNNEQPLNPEESTYWCSMYPLSTDGESSVMADTTVNKQTEIDNFSYSDYAENFHSETVEVLFMESKDFSESSLEPTDKEDRDHVKEINRYKDTDDTIQDIVPNIRPNDERMYNLVSKEKMEVSSKENSDILDDHVDVTCEITKGDGSMQIEIKSAEQSDVAKMGVKTVNVEFNDGETSEREVRIETVKESRPAKKLADCEIQLEIEKGTILEKTEVLETNKWKGALIEKRCQDRREVFSADNETSESDSSPNAVGRMVVISKHPKIHQVKAVPVVPPKPQHCRITALNLRQQQQQEQHRDRLDSDIGKEAMMKAVMQQDDICEGEHEKDRDNGGREKEKPKLSGGEREGGKDVSRNSPLSMYFDEAVAIATMRREKEKECEKERQREWGNEMQ